jgi:diguanylate cyclase (GGDEF)-like protein
MRRFKNARHAVTAALAVADGRPLAHDEVAQVAERLADELEALTAAYQRLRLEKEELAERLHRDAVTGVASRAAWEEAVEREELHRGRSGSTTSVAIVDVDGLKAINDEIGHAFGDEILRQCGALLARSVRGTDMVARIGGDEFGILLRYTDAQRAETWCARLEERRRELHHPLLSLSVGTASVPPSRSVAEAVHEADRQMYKMKKLARGAGRAGAAV